MFNGVIFWNAHTWIKWRWLLQATLHIANPLVKPHKEDLMLVLQLLCQPTTVFALCQCFSSNILQ